MSLPKLKVDPLGQYDRRKTPYSPEVIKHIKMNVKRVWERVSSTNGWKQTVLAEKLGMSQSAVSKLLNDLDGHPWTIKRIEQFAEHCGVSVSEIVDDKNVREEFFPDWSDDEIDSLIDKAVLEEECFSALEAHFDASGLAPKKEKLHRMAEKLAKKFKETSRTKKDMQEEIRNVILEEAAGV